MTLRLMRFFLRAALAAACLLPIAAHAAPAPAPAIAAELAPAVKAESTPPASAQPLPADFLGSLIKLPAAPQSVGPQPAVVRPATPLPTVAAPLRNLVISYVDRGNADAEQDCLARAVYFEARSEPLEGQLAVAQVILNRAASGVYPTTVCEVVTQPAQFSFVRRGRLPEADKTSDCWHRALAIADIARHRATAGEIAANVLWYHATYVSPSWGRLRTRFAQIGRHIFFS